ELIDLAVGEAEGGLPAEVALDEHGNIAALADKSLHMEGGRGTCIRGAGAATVLLDGDGILLTMQAAASPVRQLRGAAHVAAEKAIETAGRLPRAAASLAALAAGLTTAGVV